MTPKKYLFALITLVSGFVSAQTTRTWTGAVNNLWSDAANWSTNVVPSPGDAILITDSPNDPALSANTVVGALTIEAGAALSLDNYELTVTGDWNNAGVLNAGTSTVIFGGTTHQSINGNQAFYNLKTNNEGGVSIVSGSDSLRGVLTLVIGTFNTNDSLVILSDASHTGSIGPIVNGTINGEIIMQRYLEVVSDQWRFFSSPVVNSTLENINDDIWTSGFPGSTYPADAFNSVYFYDETMPGTADNGYVGAGNITQVIGLGQGFMAYIGTSSLSGIIEFKGEPNAGVIDLPVTYTLSDTVSDGWNLVGNPYPSAIDWDHAGVTKAGIDNAIYTWNPELGTYTSYIDGIGTNGGSAIIPACKSFYVLANSANPVLQVTEECKTASQPVFLKNSVATSGLSVIIENSIGSDEAVINMNDGATNAFDGSSDAIKMYSTTPGMPFVCTSMDNDPYFYYSINQFPAQEITIPLYVWTGTSEMHTISFEGIDEFESFSCVHIEDLATGMVYNLAETNSISVYIADTTSAPRFMIKFGAPVFVEGYNETCFDADNGFINFAKNSTEEFDITWKNDCGTVLSAETGIYQLSSIDHLAAGIYTVETTDQLCGNRIDTVVIAQPALIHADFVMSEDTVYSEDLTTEILFTNQSDNASYFEWNFADADVSSAVNPSYEFEGQGVFTVTLTAYQGAACYQQTEQQVYIISTLAVNDEQHDEARFIVTGDEVMIMAPRADRVEVRTVSGQLISTSGGFTQQTTLDLSGIPHQLLLISLMDGENSSTCKIMH